MSSVLNGDGVIYPPANIPLVPEEKAAISDFALVKLPKSTAFPTEAIVMYSTISFVSCVEGVTENPC